MTQPKSIIPLVCPGGTRAARAVGTCLQWALAQPCPCAPGLRWSLVLQPPGQKEGPMLAGCWQGRAGRIRPAGYLGGGRGESIASSGAAVRYPPPPSKNTQLPRHPAHPSPCMHPCPGGVPASRPGVLLGERAWEQPGRRGWGKVTPDRPPQQRRCPLPRLLRHPREGSSPPGTPCSSP